MTDFQDAINTVIAELTPQPWDYTDPTGPTLTVIPAGLREEPGYAEVMVRITADKTRAAEIGITTADLPGFIAALENRQSWTHSTPTYDAIAVRPDALGVALGVVEARHEGNTHRSVTTYIHVPEAQRLPLASALRRATDVARGWED